MAVWLMVLGLAAGAPGADASPAAGSGPAVVLIVRHAEKPQGDDPHLSSRGAARAAALPSLFVAPPRFPTQPAPFPTPDFVFAAQASKNSNRSAETVAPPAKALGLTVDDSYPHTAFQKLADRLFDDPRYAGRVVLVCWHQGEIPDLARAVAARAANADKLGRQIPDNWKASVFDRVWELRFDDRGRAAFRDRPQRLLFGDAAK